MWWPAGTSFAGCRSGPQLLKFVFAKFVEQDRQTMEKQSEGLKHNPHLMLIDDADRPAKWYFALKAAYLEARRTGGEMKHPMSGTGNVEVEELSSRGWCIAAGVGESGARFIGQCVTSQRSPASPTLPRGS